MELRGKKSATSTEMLRTHYTSYTPGYEEKLQQKSLSFRTQDKGIEACFLFYFVQIMTCHLQRWAPRLSEAISDYGNFDSYVKTFGLQSEEFFLSTEIFLLHFSLCLGMLASTLCFCVCVCLKGLGHQMD